MLVADDVSRTSFLDMFFLLICSEELLRFSAVLFGFFDEMSDEDNEDSEDAEDDDEERDDSDDRGDNCEAELFGVHEDSFLLKDKFELLSITVFLVLDE